MYLANTLFRIGQASDNQLVDLKIHSHYGLGQVVLDSLSNLGLELCVHELHVGMPPQCRVTSKLNIKRCITNVNSILESLEIFHYSLAATTQSPGFEYCYLALLHVQLLFGLSHLRLDISFSFIRIQGPQLQETIGW